MLQELQQGQGGRESHNDQERFGGTIAAAANRATSSSTSAHIEAAVDYILDDCFFSVGQGVGADTAIEHNALIWWRNRYRAKFLRAMTSFGNTWLADRHRVIAVCRILGEQAVKHAELKPAIDLESAARASNDIERFCTQHAIRRSRRLGLPTDRPDLFAGYWCAP